jgi:hypothetical protein
MTQGGAFYVYANSSLLLARILHKHMQNQTGYELMSQFLEESFSTGALEKSKKLWKTNLAYYFSLTMAAIVLGGALPEANAQMGLYQDEVFSRLKGSGDFSPLGDDLFGDSVNYYDGQIDFMVVDVEIPGNNDLPVRFVRSFKSMFSDLPSTRFMGDWEIEAAYISGMYAESHPWRSDRCTGPQSSAQARAPMVPNHPDPIDPTAFQWFQPYHYWDGITIRIPGFGDKKILWRDAAYLPAPTDGESYPWVTNDHVQIACLPELSSGQSGEGFLAVTPDGTRYYFDWLVTAPYRELGVLNPNASETGPDPLFFFIKRTYFRIFVSKVEDRFGNFVDYTYDEDRPVKIESSDGRLITISYNLDGRVDTVSAHGSTWDYSYQPRNSENSYLSKVTLPDGSNWLYSESLRPRSVRHHYLSGLG